MKDFVVTRLGPDGKKTLEMHIGFRQTRFGNDSMVICYGCASVLLDKKRHWFNYLFDHSLDWNVVTNLAVTPITKCLINADQLCEVGTQIINNIIEFIVREN